MKTMMMKLSKVEESEKSSRSEEDSSSSGRLLRDIEEISKALYLQKKNPPRSLISPSDDYRSKSAGESKPNNNNVNEDSSLQKGNKSSSIWSWKPLKALTHIRSHRFNCCFFLRVHSIKGLPSNLNDLGLYVHWKRKDQVLQTCPARVSEGMAEFEETLMHRCLIYATKNGGSQDSTKYEPKLFLLYASVVGAPALDIGKHWLDLTRLLPLTFEENKRRSSSGKWMTSFNLTRKAKGAILSVSFGFSSSGVDGSFQSRTSFVKVSDLLKGSEPSSMDDDQVGDFCRTSGSSMLQRFVSIPSNSNHVSSQFNDVFPKRGSELTRSITFLYNNKLDKEHLGDLEEEEDFNLYYEHLGPHKSHASSSSESGGESSGNESNDMTEFTVIEQGIEYSSDDWSEIQTIDVAEGDEEEVMESNSKGNLIKDDEEVDGENYLCSQEPTIEVIEWVESSSVNDEKGFLEQEENFKTELSKGGGKMKKSLSFDDVTTESVTNEFLNLLSFKQSQLDVGCSSSEPESPRERLLREFEKDAIASGKNPFFDFDAAEHSGAALGDCTPDYDLSLFIQAAKKDDDGDGDDDDDDDDDDWVRQLLKSRRRDAKMLENLETEALMQQWGLNETAFENSPSGGFGSPVYIYPREELPPQLLPILGEGLDVVIKTRVGVFCGQ